MISDRPTSAWNSLGGLLFLSPLGGVFPPDAQLFGLGDLAFFGGLH
jgi:hypothetical protein